MKILFVAGSKIPSTSANSIQVMRDCESLANQGAKVLLYCRQGESNNEQDHRYYGVENNFDIAKFNKGKALLGSIASYYKMKQLLDRFDPDYVYGRHFKSLVVSILMGYPTLMEVHNPITSRIKHHLFSFFDRTKKFQKIIFISKKLKKYYQKTYNMSEENTETIPCGSPSTRNASPKKIKGNFDFNVGYVGSLNERKGIGLITDLAQLLPDVGFHIVGGNEEQVRKWSTKDNENVGNQLFYGWVEPHDTDGYLQAFDVLLIPYQRISRGDNDTVNVYNSPIKIFEAMASRKPLIASDLPALREIVVDGETGMLCDPNKPKEWATSLKRIRNDKGFSDKIAKQAWQYFVKEYSHRSRAKKILATLQEF